MSFSLTGPLTFLTMVLEVSSKNSTLTWVTPPLEPVLPRTLITFAKVTGVLESCNKINVTESWVHVSMVNSTTNWDIEGLIYSIIRFFFFFFFKWKLTLV